MTIDFDTGKQIRLTPEQEKMNLLKHGTRPWRLSPANVVQAAEADLAAVIHNNKVRAERSRETDDRGIEADWRLRKLNFLDIHVIGQPNVVSVLESALEGQAGIMEAHDKEGFLKRDQVMLYESEDLLKASIELAKAGQ